MKDAKGRPVELQRMTYEAERQWKAAERAGRTPRANRYEQDYKPERTRANPRALPTRTITEVR